LFQTPRFAGTTRVVRAKFLARRQHMVCVPSDATDKSELVYPLAGVTVIEFGAYLAGPLVGLHLRHLGARVISVVRPLSSRGAQDEADWRPETVQALRDGKELVQIDLSTDAGKYMVWDMIQEMADVVIENYRPGVAAKHGIDATACRSRKPSLIHLSLPGFASVDKAFAGFPAWEAVILATAGVFRDMGVNRQLMGVPASYSPLPLASSYGSVLAAVAVVAALLRQARVVAATGSADCIQGDSIEVPLASALMDTLVHNSIHFDCPEAYMSRRKRALQEHGDPFDYEEVQELMDPFYCHYRCADGRPFYLVAPCHMRHQMRTLQVLGLQEEAAAMGVPIATPYEATKVENSQGLGAGQVGDRWAPALRRMMRRVFLTRSAFDWEQLLGAAGVPGAAHRSTTEWLESPHAREAGLVVETDEGTVQPGPAAWVHEVLPDDDLDDDHEELELHLRPRPQLTDLENGPWLEGVKVLDLANVIAGPTIGATLARFGAEVLKIDAPMPTYSPEITVVYGLAANMGKRSILLDVKDGADSSSSNEATGRAAFAALVAQADVVVMNCTPSCLQRLRLTPKDLRKMNPFAILTRFDAWGGPSREGHRTDHLGYDDNVQAALGIMERFGGGLGRVEEHAHVGTIDVVAGFGGALATVAALLHRERMGNDAAGCTLVARASLASLGQIVQFPYCCGSLETLRAEAANAATRLGPECRGDHSLLHCYEVGHEEWLLLAACLHQPAGVDDAHVTRLAGAHVALGVAVDKASGQTCHEGSVAQFDNALHWELVAAFKHSGHSAEEWVRILARAGIASAVLHSMSEIRSQNLVDNMSLSGPTFQFVTDSEHPIGGPVTMFGQCSVRTDARRLTVPTAPAPRYGFHSEEVLKEVGVNFEELAARGVAASHWTQDHSYLPHFQQRAGHIPKDQLVCPVCLEVDQPQMELSCGHCLCLACGLKSSQAGHEQCPLCRRPHLLNPEGLAARDNEYRRQYAAWRAGGQAGATGEVSNIVAPRTPMEHRSRSMPDLRQAAQGGLPEAWSQQAAVPLAHLATTARKKACYPAGAAAMGCGTSSTEGSAERAAPASSHTLVEHRQHPGGWFSQSLRWAALESFGGLMALNSSREFQDASSVWGSVFQ